MAVQHLPPDALGSPEDRGWARWEQVHATGFHRSTISVVPRDGHCSMATCSSTPVAAIRRTSSGARPDYWQPYCDFHAYDRGVERTASGLTWTVEYLAATGYGERGTR